MDLLCPWDAAQYFIYSDNIPTLFFYSHIPAIIVALFVGFLVFFKDKTSQMARILMYITALFSVWCIFDLVLWATNRPDVVMFFWSMQILIEPLIYLLGFYMTYIFIKRKDVSFRAMAVGMLIYSPIVIFLSTKYNLIGVDLYDCTAMEGVIAQYFTYGVEFLFVILILFLMSRGYKEHPERKSEISTFSIGVIAFLLAFSWGNLIGSFTDNWTLAQAGLIGMPIFVAFLAYTIIQFHSFNVKLFGAQALMGALWLSVLSMLLVRTITNIRIITLLTLLLVSVVGYLLVKSVEREIERKEQLEKANAELQTLIKQRESLMHLITHKVKGSFTHSKYIFAGMLDGTFGEINDEVKRRSEQGLESNDTGIKTIDMVLNSENMQKGLVKYDMKKTDFKDVVLKVISEKKIAAEKKGLRLEHSINKSSYEIMGDSFWIKEAVNNLIENSLKYTKEGEINVSLSRNGEKILLSVKDTGVGITEEDKKNLFTEGGRGKDSVKVNVDSTGYGLYSVKLIVEAHKGHVWAESAGAGTGSTFYIELEATS